jgi:adenylate cyclase
MLGRLVPCGGGPPIPLLKPKLVVGRLPSCDLPLCYPTVSAHHCELELRDGYWFVRDLGSSNGTRVNGSLCTRQWLQPNDVLGVSGHRYTVCYDAPADRPPPDRIADAQPQRQPAAALPNSPQGSPKPVAPPTARPRAPGPALGQLVPCGGGVVVPLRQPRVVIGRGDDCDIILRYATVSGRHCELVWAGDSWLVRDMGSLNGIRVDGVRCTAHRLRPGSILWIGGPRFEIVYSTEGMPTQPELRPSQLVQDVLEKAGLISGPPQPDDPDCTRGAEEPSPQPAPEEN